VQDTVQRPFVTSLIPTVGFFSVGFQPVITVISDGVQMQVIAVISADRRYVRLTVAPVFTTITDVQTFSFLSGVGAGTQGGNTGNQLGQQGGFGGGQQGGFGGLAGIGGQSQTQGGQTTQGQTQQGQQQQGQNGAATQVTVQQPIVEFITIGTTVSVPDGGTVLLGGIKRLREGRTMAGVPILNKIPYISRLFKNTGVGRETESLMMMVTPRIIILEEEEELLGIPVQ
jgi:type II secretory pathway component GspD/PulD (secretin)